MFRTVVPQSPRSLQLTCLQCSGAGKCRVTTRQRLTRFFDQPLSLLLLQQITAGDRSGLSCILSGIATCILSDIATCDGFLEGIHFSRLLSLSRIGCEVRIRLRRIKQRGVGSGPRAARIERLQELIW